MQTLSLVRSREDVETAFDKIRDFEPSFVMLFASYQLLKDEAFAVALCSGLKNITAVGCSTAGEISSQGIHDNSIVFLAVKLERSVCRVASAPIVRMSDSEQAGTVVAEQLFGDDLHAVLTLAPGVNFNGSAFTRGLYNKLGNSVVISGGMAGDDANFQQTLTFFCGKIAADLAVAVGLYGDELEISTGSEGGWRPFGPARRVTRAEGSVLYELDGKPALQLYKEYLGEKARYLPTSGLQYPFAILDENRRPVGIIRTAFDIDHEKGSLILAGEIKTGALVCLMHAENEGLTEGARRAAEIAFAANKGDKSNGFAILITCTGRRLVLSVDAEEEVDVVRDVFGADTPLAGFYSFGEICCAQESQKPELHNQTMTITYVTERRNT